jgi:hypothetical protein
MKRYGQAITNNIGSHHQNMGNTSHDSSGMGINSSMFQKKMSFTPKGSSGQVFLAF